MADNRTDKLASRGIRGEEAEAAVRYFDAHGGVAAAHRALTAVFGHAALPAVLVLISGGQDG